MYRRFFTALAALVFTFGLSGQPAKADPAVTAIAGAGIAQLLIGIALNPDMPDADREIVSFGGGVFDVVDDEDQAALYNIEYEAPITFYRFRPIGGIIGTSDKAIGGYLGFRHDVNIGKNLVLSADVTAAAADWGDGKYLGSTVVLRSGLNLAYRFDNGVRIQGGFHHMSHGELFDDVNPGTETATFSIAIPTDTIFGSQSVKGKHLWPKLLGW